MYSYKLNMFVFKVLLPPNFTQLKNLSAFTLYITACEDELRCSQGSVQFVIC